MSENKHDATPEETTPVKILKSSVSGSCCGGLAPDSRQLDTATLENGEDIKKKVQSYYAERVQTPGAGCCTKNTPATDLITTLAGYDAATLNSLPDAAVEKSFGCGNPLQFADVQPGQTVLDIGSGAGIDCFIASKKVGPTGKVIGLDMTPAMLDTARRNAHDGGYTNVEFRQGDAEHMPIADNSIDWVISNCVINLAPDKRKVFAEIRRVLKPGGHISISDLVADALPDSVRGNSSAYCGCIGGAISTEEYLSLLTQAGLVEVRIDSRLDYDPAQIAGIILEDSSLRSMYGGVIDRAGELLNQVKVASIKVVGRKPEATEKAIYNIERLQDRHVPALQRLLTENQLPLDGLDMSVNDAFVATHDGHVIGAVTMERYEHAGLLRSFVVAGGWRGRGVGTASAGALLKHAAATGIREVYLLTNTIKDMAAHFGFHLIRRDEVPAAVRESVEFCLPQCDNAAVMKLELPA